LAVKTPGQEPVLPHAATTPPSLSAGREETASAAAGVEGVSVDPTMTAPHPLVDYFGRIHSYLRISITDRCDLRCKYCMPAEGIVLQPRAQILTLEEIERLARLLVKLGVTKIRLTGGEPMVRKGILGLMRSLGRIPGVRELGVTSNGVLLADQVPQVVEAGVTHLNLSLDTWRADRFLQITRRDDFARVRRCLDQALVGGFKSVKLNCVVMAGVNDDELWDFVAFTREHPISVRFIEYMPFSGNGWDFGHLFPYLKMKARIEERFTLAPLPRSNRNDTTTLFQVPGHAGTVGFITSMTEHFCGTCNRLRLTSDGNIKNCLFDNGELGLRDPLRAGASDEALEAIIRESVRRKFEHHGGHETPDLIALDPGRSMIQIGG